MKKRKDRLKQIWKAAVMLGISMCIAGMTAGAVFADTTRSESSLVETPSDAVKMRSLVTGEIWENWVGDLSFLSGEKGLGTIEEPYQISTKSQLMGLSELAAMGMHVEDGSYPGDYSESHFMLTKNIDLGGMDWIPIGFYRTEADMVLGEASPFTGSFDGNGKTISNFRLYHPEWTDMGLFGILDGAEIYDLTVEPGYVLTGKERVGILAGTADNSRIRNVQAAGSLNTVGHVGGIVGVTAENTVVENCTADHISMNAGTGKESFIGGIVGKATESLIADCMVNTGNSLSARIQGGGYTGGIVGFQNHTDIYNVHVMGTIGGAGSQSIGGITGKYASGKMKVARFEGTIASSGLGSLAREGTFIGTHDTGFHFRYGTEAGADIAYLFADTEAKIAADICGSGIPDDNRFSYDAHIGFWHKGDNYFTLVQGQNSKKETERYFYEELEQGVLHVIDSEEFPEDILFSPDHFAPNATGRPTRGYLLSVLQIDAVTGMEHYYDVAALTVRGESAYSKELDKQIRGAVAAGDIVTIITSPKNTSEEKYQMNGVPTYTDAFGKRIDTSYQTGGFYTFVMPEHDTEISAVYKKVAAHVRVEPEEYRFKVVQERSGNRKQPSITTEVRDVNGKLIAQYVNGALAESVKVQDVTFEAIVDKNNDVADSRVSWSVDDGELLTLKKNEDEDYEGYTQMRACVELNLEAGFFKDIIEQAEKAQREKQYRYPIPDTVYGNGVQGGLAVLTAKTKPAASFEGKSVMANCRIPVTFQIKDRTWVLLEQMDLNMKQMDITITRKLTGNRKNPKEELLVSVPYSLRASFVPAYFDKKQVEWSISHPELLQLKTDGMDDTRVSVQAVTDAVWIRELMQADDLAYEKNKNIERKASGSRSTMITVTADDVMGNKKNASCQVLIKFVTEDKTVLQSSGSSGSSGGSSGAGASKSASSGLVQGTWSKDEWGRWTYQKNGIHYSNQWAYIENPYAKESQNQAAWFWFDANGVMRTGWFFDLKDGFWYFLHDFPDGNQGAMYTGWHVVNRRWYFFGTDGRMYYNAVTPDGFTVDETGAWVINGIVQEE